MTETSLYTKCIVKNEKGIFEVQMIRREHGQEDSIIEGEEFSKSKAITDQKYVPSFFNRFYSTPGLLLLVNGRSCYIRNKKTSDWIRRINFASLITAIYPVKDAFSDQPKILCVTESSLELLVLEPNGENISYSTSSCAIPGKLIRTNLS